MLKWVKIACLLTSMIINEEQLHWLIQCVDITQIKHYIMRTLTDWFCYNAAHNMTLKYIAGTTSPFRKQKMRTCF